MFKTKELPTLFYSSRQRRSKLIAMGQRQPVSERRDRWVLIGTVLFTSMHFAFAIISSIFGAASLEVSNPFLSKILFDLGILVALMTMIFAFMLFFVGNLQFRESAISVLKRIILCPLTRKQRIQPRQQAPKVLSKFQFPLSQKILHSSTQDLTNKALKKFNETRNARCNVELTIEKSAKNQQKTNTTAREHSSKRISKRRTSTCFESSLSWTTINEQPSSKSIRSGIFRSNSSKLTMQLDDVTNSKNNTQFVDQTQYFKSEPKKANNTVSAVGENIVYNQNVVDEIIQNGE